MKLLDTNVLIYAHGKPSRFKEPCAGIVRAAGDDPSAYGVDTELLQELLDVYGRRGERRLGVRTVDQALVVFPEPFPITRAVIEDAMELFVEFARLSPRDVLHAAVCRTYELEGIVSTDKAFDRIQGLTRFDPLKLAV